MTSSGVSAAKAESSRVDDHHEGARGDEQARAEAVVERAN